MAFDPDPIRRPVEHAIDRLTPGASPESSRAILPILIVVVAVLVVIGVVIAVRSARFKKRQAVLLNRPFKNPPPSER